MARTTFSGPVASDNGFVFTSGNYTMTLKSASLAANYTLTLPADDGTNGQVLTTNGSGVLTWTTNGAGTVTSVGGAGTVNGLTLTGTVTSSGSLTLGGSFALPQATAANLADIGNAINTTGKYTGKMVVDIATGIIYTAVGATAGSNWMPSDASGAVTPV